MARKPTEQSPGGVESVTVAEVAREGAGEIPEQTGGVEEAIHTIEHRASNGVAETIEMKGEADTTGEQTDNNDAELNGPEAPAQPQKRAASRKRAKPAEPAAPAAEAEATSQPKKPATRQRKKAVESVSQASEAAETPEPKKPATRKRKKPVEPASPAIEASETPGPAAEEVIAASKNAPEADVPETINAEATVQAEAGTQEAPLAEEAIPLVEETSSGVTSIEEPGASLETGVEVPQEPATTIESIEAASASGEETQEPAAAFEGGSSAQEGSRSAGEEKLVAHNDVEEMVTIIEAIRVSEEEATSPAAVIEEAPAAEQNVVSAPATERRHLVKSAALVSIGNLGSSLMGMVRQIVVTSLGTPISTPFNAALTPANNFFQLLINGSVSGALVPTFNDYAAPEKRQELRRLVFTLVNLVLIIGVASAIGYALIAPWFINVLVSGYPANEKLLTLQYSQIIFFSLAALGPFAVLLAALFALKEFGWPAFATAAYHVGIILGAIAVGYLSSFYVGLMALPIGVLLGSLGEIALLIPGMRNQHLSYMFVLDLKHPALRRILKLYFPIAISFVFTTLLVFLDLHLQSLTPGHPVDNTTAMATATTLIQFPIGLVAMALSFAVLPTLSEHAREGNNERFKATLLLGFRVGLLLMIPAMVGLIVLRIPIVDLIFAHRNYHTSNAALTALALQNYAYQLPFVAIDQLLIAAFYARKNTKIPVIIGVVSILFYLGVALPFYSNIGMPALAFANTIQNSSHAIILLFLLRRAMGSLHIRATLPAILKICAAAAVMGVVAWGTMALLGHISLFSLNHLLGQFLTVIVAGGLAVAVYVGGILLLKVEEINLVKVAVLAKLGKK